MPDHRAAAAVCRCPRSGRRRQRQARATPQHPGLDGAGKLVVRPLTRAHVQEATSPSGAAGGVTDQRRQSYRPYYYRIGRQQPYVQQSLWWMPCERLTFTPFRGALPVRHLPCVQVHREISIAMSIADQWPGRVYADAEFLLEFACEAIEACLSGASLPPGNSHEPAMLLPAGRWAMSTLPVSSSITPAMT
jgi:hypothetical protein